MPDFRIYFDFKSRLARLDYWRMWLTLSVAGATVWCAGLFAILALGPLGAVLLLPMVAFFAANTAILVRRLHDRNRSALWIVPFIFGPGLVGDWAERHLVRAPVLSLVALLIALSLWAWGLVEIGFLRGTPGPNRFGDNPQAS